MTDIDGAPKIRDPLETMLGYQLRRASAVMMADLAESLLPTGLRPAEASILMLIDATPGCTQSDVGRVLGIKRANMVPLIAGLIKAELVDRSPVDGRSQALFLSTAGEAMIIKVRAAIAAHEGRFQTLFDPAALEVMLDALRDVRAAGQGFREGA